MDTFPDLPAATSDAARWDLEFALDPGGSASGYAMALNTLAISQIANTMPDAAVASFLKAVEALGHGKDVDPIELDLVLMNLTSALVEQGDFERALEFATRAVENQRHLDNDSFALACALGEKAHILRRLGRTAEELDLHLESLALLALPHNVPDYLAEDAERVVAKTGQRIEELLQEQPS